MNKFALTFIGIVIMSGILSISVKGQTTVTSQIFAEVIPALSATETSQLNFGRFSPGSQGGQIIISPDGIISIVGTVVQNNGSYSAASYYITGDSRTAYSITLPSGPVVLTDTRDSKTMTVTNWVSSPNAGAAGGNLRNGSDVVKVGATLMIGLMEDNPEGIYTGTYTITFDYN